MPLTNRPVYLSNAVNFGTMSLLDGVVQAIMVTNSGPPSSQAWPANNRALFYPLIVNEPRIITAMHVTFGTATGNFDYGLYDENLNKLFSTGSTAMSGSGSRDIADTLVPRGTVYLALAHSTTGASLSGYGVFAGILASLGVFEMDNALPLPDVAVPARISTNPRLYSATISFRSLV